jgi:hypothetical protein
MFLKICKTSSLYGQLLHSHSSQSHAGDDSYADWDADYEEFRASNEGVPLTEAQPE